MERAHIKEIKGNNPNVFGKNPHSSREMQEDDWKEQQAFSGCSWAFGLPNDFWPTFIEPGSQNGRKWATWD